MYIPSAFRVDDRTVLFDFIEQHAFATLVTAPQGAPFATHLPVLLDRERGVLRAHVARANPQWRHFADGSEALMIFQGPHGYVSPAWYATAPAVPTWNYSAVHVYGRPRLTDDEETSRLLDDLVRTYESPREQPWPADVPADFRAKLLQAIVGFEVPIERMEGKFKLSQNRSAEDRTGVIAALQACERSEDRALAALMETVHSSKDL